MLTPKKKITKKELKQDPLFTALGQLEVFYEQNKKYISYALTGIVVVVIAVLMFINNRRANNEKAAAEFGKVFKTYDQAVGDSKQYTTAINGQPERGIMGLKAIVENYGGTDSGELARFYLANAYFNLGKYDEALTQYDKFSGGDNLLVASALAGMGGCYEAKKEYSKAASNYEKAASKASNASSSPEYLNAAARCYGLSGEKEKAIAIFKRLKKEYPTSTFAREADRYISQLSA
ncbi:MAG: tetratricopeptide repeat protein [Ignavibacteriae bacterium]|nr:tetratricopeptide repeat protein [Ignavibacteria bacterium]MBI3363472.1 tetratricopeptide repeat protein [Ignavibacteriota bacterium]